MNNLYFNQVMTKYLLSKTYKMNSYTKSYNFGYLSTDDRLKGNNNYCIVIQKIIEIIG